MVQPTKSVDHHGVFMQVNGHGILIIGQPGIGKSSFALELLHQGQQLIADDIIEFTQLNKRLIGSCPQMSKGLLHSRELGLVSVTQLFGNDAHNQQHQLDYVVELKTNLENTANLSPTKVYEIDGVIFPLLQLSINSPASLYHRLLTWLAIQASDYDAEKTLKQRQQQQMSRNQQNKI
jgi:HPr kinase/phosphorylase